MKIRTGWDDHSLVALEVGRIVENEGAQALTIHGRTKVQGYSGEANWKLIAEVAETLNIPVIGNQLQFTLFRKKTDVKLIF